MFTFVKRRALDVILMLSFIKDKDK